MVVMFLMTVEINTISSSFGVQACKIDKLHRHINSMHILDCIKTGEGDVIPVNNSHDQIANGLCYASQHYNNQLNTSNTIVIMVIQRKERNLFDQVRRFA